MRKVPLVLAALLAFLGTLLWRAPAGWLNRALPAQAQCAGYGGTIWNGRCTQLSFDGLNLGRISWQLQALPLLLGRLSLQLTVQAPQLDLRGHLQLHGAAVEVRELSGQAGTQLLQVPLPRNVRGSVRFENVSVTLQQRTLTHLAGQAVLTNLSLGDGANSLGEYQLQFPDAGADTAPFNGRLRDRSGPFALSAALRISANLAFDLEGSVALRQDADPQLARVLDWAGPADADGVRSLSISGTF